MPTFQMRRGAVSGLPSLAAGQPGFTTDQFRLYVGSSGGNRLVGLLHNVAGTTAPTVNEDAGDGYSVGSVWIDTTNDKGYVCADSTVGAAVWQQFSGTGATSAITQLSGDVTAGPGSGAQTATIANDAVTFAKMQNVATSTLVGRLTVGTGDPESITLSPVLATFVVAANGDQARTAIGNQHYILLRDEKGATTEGGSNTGGSYQTRTLNTEVTDTGGHCTLSSNQFTLTAGTYHIRARVPGYRCGRHQARLRNVTDSTTVIQGTPAYSENATNVQGWCFIEGRFTIAASKALEIQHYTTTSVTSQGWGLYGDGTNTSVYTVVELEKED